MKPNCLVIDLLEGTEKYGPDITAFVSLMIEKLHQHRNKGHWQDIDIEYALNRIREEVDELEEAIKNNNKFEIHREAADVANFALIISSVLRRMQLQHTGKNNE